MSLPPPLSPCSILILAGGRGSRMGGHDKGWVSWQGRPLVEWVHDTVRPLTDDLIISCNRHRARYATLAEQTVADAEPDHPGPLAGIRAGLAVMRHDVLVVLPCDAPRVDRPLVQALRHLAQANPGLPVMARRGEEWEPLFCLVPGSLRAAIEAAWAAGERSPRRLLRDLGAVALALAPDDARLANFNSPAQLDQPR